MAVLVPLLYWLSAKIVAYDINGRNVCENRKFEANIKEYLKKANFYLLSVGIDTRN